MQLAKQVQAFRANTTSPHHATSVPETGKPAVHHTTMEANSLHRKQTTTAPIRL